MSFDSCTTLLASEEGFKKLPARIGAASPDCAASPRAAIPILSSRSTSDPSICRTLGNTNCASQDNQRRPIIKKERVSRAGSELWARPNVEDANDPERLTQTYLEQINVNREFRDVADFFRPIRYLHVVPQLVRDPDRSIGRSDDPYGGGLLGQIARTPESLAAPH